VHEYLRNKIHTLAKKPRIVYTNKTEYEINAKLVQALYSESTPLKNLMDRYRNIRCYATSQ
jgi:hypothetical protein